VNEKELQQEIESVIGEAREAKEKSTTQKKSTESENTSQ